MANEVSNIIFSRSRNRFIVVAIESECHYPRWRPIWPPTHKNRYISAHKAWIGGGGFGTALRDHHLLNTDENSKRIVSELFDSICSAHNSRSRSYKVLTLKISL